MRWKVLVSAPYMQPVIDRFRPLFAEQNIELFVPPVKERFEEEDLLQWMHDIDGVIAGDDRFTSRVLEASPKLKVISKWGTGIDSFDQEACQRLGIAICNTPNAFSEPVADSVLGYILCFARQLPWMDKYMKNNGWHKMPGRALNESVLGVIGVGNVGKAVVRRAKAFGLRILGNDPVIPSTEFIRESKIEMVERDTLLAQADFVSLNCDLNPTSHHLMNARAFHQMKQSAILINTARGPIVHEEALVAALQQGQLAGAALDVFEHEPLPADSLLYQMDNVLLAPHNSNSSPAAWERVHQNTIKNLLEELNRKSNG
ncbi:MAG: phosphoglycerate dehydrogenase [Anaerolineales bacterium]|nr:phosphoglycerate dehydrogenase [Anaerolineales bacterium]